jgi:hypothetical protein
MNAKTSGSKSQKPNPQSGKGSAQTKQQRRADATQAAILNRTLRQENDRLRKEIAVKNTGQKQLTAAKQRQVSQGQNLARKLKPASAAFFTSAIDPMHDSSIGLRGWPDRNPSLSVVRKIVQAFDVAKPASTNPNFPDDSPWQAHFVLQPWLQNINFSVCPRNNTTLGATTSQTTTGGFECHAVANGADFFYPAIGAMNDLVQRLGALYLDRAYTEGTGRVIGIWIEVINTTAPLYKSGSITCWKAPQPACQPATYYRDATPAYPATCQAYRYPARSAAEALLYTGATEWEAGEGSYMAGTFVDFENPAITAGYVQPLLSNAPSSEDMTYIYGDVSTINTQSVLIPSSIPGSGPLPNTARSYPCVRLYPYNQMGMVFTGLSPQTTLKAKLNVYYESFPNRAEIELLNLARPTTPYDPFVLDLLSRVCRHLPIAVPFKYNAEGDWFDAVMKAVAMIAPEIGVLFGQPVVGAGVVAALQAFRTVRNGNTI